MTGGYLEIEAPNSSGMVRPRADVRAQQQRSAGSLRLGELRRFATGDAAEGNRLGNRVAAEAVCT